MASLEPLYIGSHIIPTATAFFFDMKQLDSYIKRDRIILLLCRMRAKIAKRRNKDHLIHLLSSSEEYNYHANDLTKLENELSKLFPSRKNWKKLGENSRRPYGKEINSIEKNIKVLQTTIRWYEKHESDAEFLINLNAFISDVQNSIYDPNYEVTSPVIYPKLKDRKKEKDNICRPISNFNLKDKIITSLINKYLTDLIDNYFYENSFAFRGIRKNGDDFESVNHHTAIRKIKKFTKENSNSLIWVSECDMKKFYDTVNHEEIKKRFNKLMIRVFKKTPDLFNSHAIRIFNSYLACYSFNHNVLPLNTDQKFFKENEIIDGKFEWVESELMEDAYYKDFRTERIGVPQGGALSGLIANIVLNVADNKLSSFTKSKNFLYVRYCDDMIILCRDKNECISATNIYSNTLKTLKLVPHKFKEVSANNKEFWKTKSKNPYQWGENENTVHWIGFVGYEINRKVEVRVRKSSLKKEMSKQYKVTNEALVAIKDNNRRVSRGYIEESIIHRLIGMSVGRISLWNYNQPINDLCWMNGFTEINKNPHSIQQLKSLDRNRNKYFKGLIKALATIDSKDDSGLERKKSRQLIYYGKPFSYYFQTIEKRDQSEP